MIECDGVHLYLFMRTHTVCSMTQQTSAVELFFYLILLASLDFNILEVQESLLLLLCFY